MYKHKYLKYKSKYIELKKLVKNDKKKLFAFIIPEFTDISFNFDT